MNIESYKKAAMITAEIEGLRERLMFWESLRSKLEADAKNPKLKHDYFSPVLILEHWSQEVGTKKMKLDDLQDNEPLMVLANHYCTRFSAEIAEKEKIIAEI